MQQQENKILLAVIRTTLSEANKASGGNDGEASSYGRARRRSEQQQQQQAQSQERRRRRATGGSIEVMSGQEEERGRHSDSRGSATPAQISDDSKQRLSLRGNPLPLKPAGLKTGAAAAAAGPSAADKAFSAWKSCVQKARSSRGRLLIPPINARSLEIPTGGDIVAGVVVGEVNVPGRAWPRSSEA